MSRGDSTAGMTVCVVGFRPNRRRAAACNRTNSSRPKDRHVRDTAVMNNAAKTTATTSSSNGNCSPGSAISCRGRTTSKAMKPIRANLLNRRMNVTSARNCTTWQSWRQKPAYGLGYLPTSTSATRFTPLQASTRLPSCVATMFRTTPPPEGIAQVWKVSDRESKRTSVLGLTPDSLYQRTSPTDAMP